MNKFLLCGFVLLLSACAPLYTQNPGQGYSPANAVSNEGADRLMLFGHDVVSYFTEGKHVLGDAKIQSVHKGLTFYFSNTTHKALFDTAPHHFLPQFGGYCANGIVYGIPWGGNADNWRIINGKLYIFGGDLSRDAFLIDQKANIALAEEYWTKEVSGNNALLQRVKRLVFRVPHYKSGAELSALVSKSK